MKNFRKNSEGHFICEVCESTFKTYKGLQLHIRWAHNAKYQEYYDKYLKDKSDNICKVCENKTKFISIIKGYKKCCTSRDCINKYRSFHSKQGILEKFGVENNFQREDIKKKSKQTKLKLYGDKNYTNTKNK